MTSPHSEAAPPITADVLRRVAAAVAGDESGAESYVVCDTNLHTRPWGIDVVHVRNGNRRAARDEAERRRREKGERADEFVVLGPYRNEPTLGPTGLDVGSVAFIAVKPPGTPPPPLPLRLYGKLDDLESVTVTLNYKNGTRSAPITTEDGFPEALFFSLSALDRFLFPYYVRVYDAEVAAALRAEWKSRIEALLHRADG